LYKEFPSIKIANCLADFFSVSKFKGAVYLKWEERGVLVNTENTRGLSGCARSGEVHSLQKSQENSWKKSLPLIKQAKPPAY
jgi:hypothetical protein